MAAPVAGPHGPPGPDGPPRKLFVGTPSKLTTWLDCPNRYRLTYLDKVPKGPPWAHSSVGLSVHNALRDWFLLPVQGRTVAAAEAALRGGWIDLGFRDRAQSARWTERAADMVARYVARLDPTDEPIGVERTVAFRTRTLALSGRADRIDLRASEDGGDELVVVDYKTGRHVLSVDDARSSLALAVYAVASARTLRRRCRRVELHHLPTGDVVVWDHDQASLDRHVARAVDIADDAQRAEEVARSRVDAAGEGRDVDLSDVFPPRPGAACGYCDVVRSCPAGIAELGGVMPAPWDVLDRWPSAPTDLPAPRTP